MNLSAVLDTNIIISGIFWSGTPRRVFVFARAGEIIGVTSRVLLFELRDVLTRQTGSFRLAPEEADRINNSLITYLQIVEPTRTIRICRDKNDNHVLEVASAGRADYIVSNDPDLQALETVS